MLAKGWLSPIFSPLSFSLFPKVILFSVFLALRHSQLSSAEKYSPKFQSPSGRRHITLIGRRTMWRLIFCVNLTGTWVAQIKHYFWVCLWRCFQKRLTFELVDWVKWFDATPEWVGIIQSTEGLNSTKRWRKNKFILTVWLHELRHQSSPVLQLVLIPFSFLVLMPLDLD